MRIHNETDKIVKEHHDDLVKAAKQLSKQGKAQWMRDEQLNKACMIEDHLMDVVIKHLLHTGPKQRKVHNFYVDCILAKFSKKCYFLGLNEN